MPARLFTLLPVARPRFALLTALLVVLAACGPKTNEFPPACPNPAFLRDLSDLLRYRANSSGRDLTDLVVRARLTALNGNCKDASPTSLETVVQVSMEVFRGPAMVGRRVEVPVFLAVVEGEAIINKRIFPIIVDFPSNLDRVVIAVPPVTLMLPVSAQKSGASYGIIAGFQLTPDELAQNQRRGF